MYLKKQNATKTISVTKVSLLTGSAYFEDSKEGVKKIITTLSEKSHRKIKEELDFDTGTFLATRFPLRFSTPYSIEPPSNIQSPLYGPDAKSLQYKETLLKLFNDRIRPRH